MSSARSSLSSVPVMDRNSSIIHFLTPTNKITTVEFVDYSLLGNTYHQGFLTWVIIKHCYLRSMSLFTIPLSHFWNKICNFVPSMVFSTFLRLFCAIIRWNSPSNRLEGNSFMTILRIFDLLKYPKNRYHTLEERGLKWQ